MKNTKMISLLFLGVMIISITTGGTISTKNNSFRAKTEQSYSLNIYTYKSLMNNPFFDIAGNFSAFSGVSKDKINITRFSDPYALMNELVKEGNHPKADIVIGIDNALTNLFNASNIFAPYDNQSVLSKIPADLQSDMGPNNNLVPFDYAMIDLTYNSSRLSSTQYPFLTNFTLDDLINSPLASNTVIENPKTSALGLAFLMWTVAIYGDPTGMVFLKGFTGNGDWHTFWQKIGKKFTIAPTYEDAYNIYSNPSNNKSLLVSYTTQQVRDYCVNNITTTKSVVTSFVNETRLNSSAWYQIEGIGMVKNSPNQALAKQFMDWFLSTKIQDKIPETNWKYPANTEATIPACFTQSGAPNPHTILKLNRYANPTTMNYYLSTWISQWEGILVTKGLPGFTGISFLLFFPLIALITIIRKNKRH